MFLKTLSADKEQFRYPKDIKAVQYFRRYSLRLGRIIQSPSLLGPLSSCVRPFYSQSLMGHYVFLLFNYFSLG